MIVIDISLEYLDGTDYKPFVVRDDIGDDQVQSVVRALRTIACLCPVEFRVMVWIREVDR